MPLHRLVYTSRAVHSGPEDMDDILASARRNNMPKYISGMLVCAGGWFLQILEGEPEALTSLFIKIGNDPRHSEITLRAFEVVDSRHFSDWGMQYVSQDRMKMDHYRRYFIEDAFDPTKMSSAALVEFCRSVNLDIGIIEAVA